MPEYYLVEACDRYGTLMLNDIESCPYVTEKIISNSFNIGIH